MGLLNNTGAPAPATGAAPAAVENKDEVRAQKKAEKEAAKKLVAAYFDPLRGTMKADLIAAFELLTKAAKAGGGGFGEPIFNKLFGANPAVGAAITVTEAFEKSGYVAGIQYMNSKIRVWKQKGVATVAYVHNPQAPNQSQWVIQKIGA